jgi:hypothetical protein
MSIKPPINCPPNYSVLVFRLTECKKAGIVKGITTQLAVDLQNMYVPISNYEEKFISLKAGETKRIDVSSIADTGRVKEQFVFTANPAFCGLGTEHSYSLYDDNLNLIETINFIVNEEYPTWPLAFHNAHESSTKIKSVVSFATNQFETKGNITSTGTDVGIKHRHVFSFDNTGFGGYSTFPFLHPGNLIAPNEKYPLGRIKLMMIYPDYYKANINAGCGCIDASGDMKSNVKYFEYAYDDNVNSINNPTSPILYDPRISTWSQNSTDHIGYHFKVGDYVSAAGNSKLRGIITSIEGYAITVDTEIGDYTLTGDQLLSHVNSPSTITWRKIGDFYLHTTAQDVITTDQDFIETLWLKNPHKYDLPIRILLAI